MNSELNIMGQLKAFNIKTRIIHMITFEVIGIIIFAPLISIFLNKSILEVGVLGLIISFIAMFWNFLYNLIFDKVERFIGLNRFERGIFIRSLHAIIFEAFLIIFTVPLIAYWLDMTLFQAFITDVAIVVFFLIYTLAFNYAFDRFYVYLQGRKI